MTENYMLLHLINKDEDELVEDVIDVETGVEVAKENKRVAENIRSVYSIYEMGFKYENDFDFLFDTMTGNIFRRPNLLQFLMIR
ncbi:hypothetical protein BpHYR1_015766 [Brachionus plicatilis]|uniref:Uncharacterized protein n=1 Tax=Brachionus plicatilis TaxID=10195 RepID=A0A3M7QA42_BRAPC|nr:hypothetical protein BpHYR1_015766 [Brachionus plicatilis]